MVRDKLSWNSSTGPSAYSAAIRFALHLYLYYGDTSVLVQHYGTMKRWVEHLQSIAQDGIVHAGLGDWCAPGSVPGNTPIPITSTAIFYLDAVIMHKAAQNGQNGGCKGVRPPRRADTRFLQMENHRGHHSTGILGLRHLFWALSKYGHGDVAMTVLHQTDYPSIGHLFALGATTLWEWWSEPDIEQQEGPRSCNHPMQGGFDAWFFSGIAGIRPSEDAPGFQRIVLMPHLLPGLQWVRASYRSIRGLIVSEWRQGEEYLHWKIALPANTEALVYLPTTDANAVTESGQPLAGRTDVRVHGVERKHLVVHIGSGEYRFEVGRRVTDIREGYRR